MSITIPTNPAFTNYSYTVDWGDGNMDTGLTDDATHTYATSGTYTVSITGTFLAIYFNNGGDGNKIRTIKQWGTNPWASMTNAFAGCSNLNIELGAGNPVLSSVTDMSDMFENAAAFNGDLSRWDVSSVTNMEEMFLFATTFNSDISGWDVSSVTDMSHMFQSATAFNQDLSGWNVSKVTTMHRMFQFAAVFNQDLSDWDVSSVTDMDDMFEDAAAFNGDLSDWDVSSVTDMSDMFQGAAAFNGDLSRWDVSSVTYMGGIFSGAAAFNQDLSGWDVSSVTVMEEMFDGAAAFNSDLSDWDVSSVTDMSEMFEDAAAFNSDLSDWDVSSVTTMSRMFNGVTLSTANYDALLVGWRTIDSDESTLQTTVIFDGGNSQYCTAGAAARNVLTDDLGNNWGITDDGEDTPANCAMVAFTGSGSIADQTYTVGDAVNFILPKAALGIPDYTYTLTGNIPTGLVFDTTMRALIGTPTMETAAVELTYTVTDCRHYDHHRHIDV